MRKAKLETPRTMESIPHESRNLFSEELWVGGVGVILVENNCGIRSEDGRLSGGYLITTRERTLESNSINMHQQHK